MITTRFNIHIIICFKKDIKLMNRITEFKIKFPLATTINRYVFTIVKKNNY